MENDVINIIQWGAIASAALAIGRVWMMASGKVADRVNLKRDVERLAEKIKEAEERAAEDATRLADKITVVNNRLSSHSDRDAAMLSAINKLETSIASLDGRLNTLNNTILKHRDKPA